MKRGLSISIAVLLACGCGRSSPPSSVPALPPATVSTAPSTPLQFSDITAEGGIDFTYRNAVEAETFGMAEALGGGAGVLDYDRDGRADLFLVGGGSIEPSVGLTGRSGALLRNRNGLQYDPVTALAGVHQANHYSHGVAISDYDSDGFEDLLITGYGGLTLYRNQGDGTFAAATESAGLSDDQWSTGAAWGDMDGDGVVDLYVAHYLNWSLENNPKCFANGQNRDTCSPTMFEGIGDTLYLSNRDGTFRDASQTAGLESAGKGLGVAMLDIEGDGDLDVYVANDTDDNFMYLNDGTGKLTEQGILSATAQDENGMPNGSMGISVFDYNDDALPDLWVANFENDSWALYRNEGRGAFTHASASTGIFAIGSSYVGWGSITDDLDSDGHDDIIVSNGHVSYFPKSGQVRQRPLVLQSQNQRFELLKFGQDSYFGQTHHGRGLVKCDMDNDGDWDLGFANMNEPFTLLRNDTPRQRPWIGLRLIGVASNRDAVGATVTLTSSEGQRTRFVCSGGSYLSHSSRRLLWTVPPDTESVKLDIRWPSGHEQQLVADEFDRYLEIVESTTR